MPSPNGLEAYMFRLVCPSVRLSVNTSVRPSVTFFSPAITKEPLARLIWNWGTLLRTSKWRAELFFRGREIQDGWLSTTFLWNLYWSITLYWTEILTSIFFLIFQKLPQKCCYYRKRPEITENGRKLPKTVGNCRKRPEITKNDQMLPIYHY